jgi:hypothetical protein
VKRHNLLLWIAIFAGPSIWFTVLLAQFALAPWACAFRWKPALYTISAVALVLVAASGLLARAEWRKVGPDMPGEAGGAIPRARLMAFAGLVLSGFSILLLLAQVIVEIGLGACQ